MTLKTLVLFTLLAASSPALAASDGAALFAANCSVCHQAEGIGSAGQFPPLKGRIDRIAESAAGKTYLADVVLNGFSGKISVQGSVYMGFMPSFGATSDDDLAAILTYLSGLGTTKPAPVITAAEIKAERATPKKSSEIAAERKALDATHPLP